MVELSDEEVEAIGEGAEKELREGKLASIATLIHDLNWSENKLAASVTKKYDKSLSELTVEELDGVIASLKAKTEKNVAQPTLDNVGEKAAIDEEQGPIRGRTMEPPGGKVIDAEIVEELWDKTVEIDAGTFKFTEEIVYVAGIPTEVLLCKNGANDNNDNFYELKIDVPKCSCKSFLINNESLEWCKHLKAAKIAGYDVKELQKMPAEIAEALVKPEKGKQKKVKKEETVAIEVLGKKVDLVVQIPQEIIRNEEIATEMIKSILGPNPKREDVIEQYSDIEEIAADVIVSLAQYSGIRYQPFNKEIEVAKMNLGKIFKAIPMTQDKMKIYGPLADLMPDTDVTVRCKITTIAGWLDKKGDLHFGMGTKEEHLTPYKLKDIATRGANFIETMCETKSAKKSILGCLPITHDGLLSKIKAIYGWK